MNAHRVNYHYCSGLFVVVSWISFVVPPEVIPGRMVKKIIPEGMDSGQMGKRDIFLVLMVN